MFAFMLGLAAGFCLCVLWPMPRINAAVERGWAALGARLRGAPREPPL